MVALERLSQLLAQDCSWLGVGAAALTQQQAIREVLVARVAARVLQFRLALQRRGKQIRVAVLGLVLALIKRAKLEALA